MRLVAVLNVEAASAYGAAGESFTIANAPWEPQDAVGFTWPHRTVRSMSSGDVVVVHTPDGMVGFVCLSFDWAQVAPFDLKIAA